MPCSGNTTVWWKVKKEPDSFNIYHRNQTFPKNPLPVPLETDVDSKVREYRHMRVPYKEDQCYRIGSVKNNRVYPSNGVLIKKLVRTKKAYFRVRSKVFNSHDNLSFTLNVLTRDGQKDIVVDSNNLTFIARSLEDWQNGNIEFDIEDSVEDLVGVHITGEIEPYETDDGVQQDVHQVTICVEALSEIDEQTGVILTVDSPDVGVKLPAVTHKANENQTIRFGEDVVSVCLLCEGGGGGVTPPPISCDGATNTSGCILWTGEEEGAIDLEVDGVKVLSNASETDLETYLFNNGDIENDLTMGCGCDVYVRMVHVPYHQYEQGQTLFLPISLEPNGQSITTPFTVQGTTTGQRRNFIADTLNSQLEPYGLYCVSGLFASSNIYLGVTDNRAKVNYKDTEFYILDAGNTFTSEEIPRGLPPYRCWYPT